LASVATHLVTAERGLDATRHVLVDVDLSCLESRCDAVRSGKVSRPYARGEAVVRVVGDADRLLLVVEGNHAGDRAEDLFARDPHIIRHAGVDRRLDEPAAP